MKTINKIEENIMKPKERVVFFYSSSYGLLLTVFSGIGGLTQNTFLIYLYL
jgi:hypothetical protein